MDAHATWCPGVPGTQDSLIVEYPQSRVAETPLPHIFPVLIEVDGRSARSYCRQFLVSVNDQSLVFRPGVTIVA